MVHYAFPMVVIRKTNETRRPASLFARNDRTIISARALFAARLFARNSFVSNQLVSVCFGHFTVCVT